MKIQIQKLEMWIRPPLFLALAWGSCLWPGSAWAGDNPVADQGWVLNCSTNNDLYQVLRANGLPCQRFDTADEAVRAASTGAGVLLLADGSPSHPRELPPSVISLAAEKNLHLYIEFPGGLPGYKFGRPRTLELGRAVVVSKRFGSQLKPLQLLDLHGSPFVTMTAPYATNLSADLVLGRVAGFDRAVFGLPTPAYPLLFEASNGRWLVGTAKLSQFVKSRYAPDDAWASVWRMILHWTNPQWPGADLHWTPTVRPAYARNVALPPDYENEALRRGVKWFRQSRLLISPQRDLVVRENAVAGRMPAPSPGDQPGDGSLGIAEGYVSHIQPDGSQFQSIARRSDCTAESAMALAFGGQLKGSEEDAEIAQNLLDYLYFTSPARKREYADPTHGAYGLIAWGMDTEAWRKATYGDDEARVMLATLAASETLHQSRWNQPLWQCLLADLRTTGRLGFREERIDLEPLGRLGWRHFFNQENTLFSPHYESYLWACFLWGWQQTGFTLFRDRAESAIRLTMRTYPDRWRWTNGMQQERARMLLPLAWLVRVDDTPEHRAWLKRVATDLLAAQDASGAIREQIGALKNGESRPPQANADYGRTEAPLLQENGDTVSDLLYTMNFAALGLHEAAAATGDLDYARAEDRLVQFLCRIQIRSQAHPELDGGWYRAFDFKKWEYWASNSDQGWGAWCIESGWTQGWICAVLALRQMRTSLWTLATNAEAPKDFAAMRREMIPDDALTISSAESEVRHAACGKPVTLLTAFSKNYPGAGTNALTDGRLADDDYLNPRWQGYHGDNLDATVDLGAVTRITRVSIRFLQSARVGIFLPQRVEIDAGNDPARLETRALITNTVPLRLAGPLIKEFTAAHLDCAARYVRVRAENIGRIPAGDPAAGEKAWLFTDELLVNPEK